MPPAHRDAKSNLPWLGHGFELAGVDRGQVLVGRARNEGLPGLRTGSRVDDGASRRSGPAGEPRLERVAGPRGEVLELADVRGAEAVGAGVVSSTQYSASHWEREMRGEEAASGHARRQATDFLRRPGKRPPIASKGSTARMFSSMKASRT